LQNMTEKAYAKINLTLDVLRKREDGYHDIKTVMQTVSLCDALEVEKDEKIRISASKPYIPTDKRNLVYTACERFFSATGVKGGARIRLKKFIPVAAGLAGGSSDAAATLRALNRLYRTKLTDDMLCEIASSFGADIPFCIKGGTALCEGIGEVITSLRPLPRANIVISIGGESASTPAMYAELSKRNAFSLIDNDGMIMAIDRGEIREIAGKLGNAFEDICAEKRPFIKEIKSAMLNSGALGACMSGSGPSVFGIFQNRKTAISCANMLKSKGYYAFYCTTV